MSPLQEKIISRYKKYKTDAPLECIARTISSDIGCCADYARKVINMYIRGTFPKPRTSKRVKVEAICPKCGKHHVILEPAHIIHKFPPRVFCEEDSSLRGRSAEGY